MPAEDSTDIDSMIDDAKLQAFYADIAARQKKDEEAYAALVARRDRLRKKAAGLARGPVGTLADPAAARALKDIEARIDALGATIAANAPGARGPGEDLPGGGADAAAGGLMPIPDAGALRRRADRSSTSSASPLGGLKATPGALAAHLAASGEVPPRFRDYIFQALKEKPEALQDLMTRDYGKSGAGVIKQIATNPIGYFIGLLNQWFIPLFFATLVFDMINQIKDELQKPGGILDKHFRDRIDNRINAFRDKETQATVVAGFRQFIVPSGTGYDSPFNAYNTYEQAENARDHLTEDFSIRHPGYP